MTFPPAAHTMPMPPHAVPGAAPGAHPGAPGVPPAAPAPPHPGEEFDAATAELEDAANAFKAAADKAADAAEMCEDCPAGVESKLRKMAEDATNLLADIQAAREAAQAILDDEASALDAPADDKPPPEGAKP